MGAVRMCPLLKGSTFFFYLPFSLQSNPNEPTGNPAKPRSASRCLPTSCPNIGDAFLPAIPPWPKRTSYPCDTSFVQPRGPSRSKSR